MKLKVAIIDDELHAIETLSYDLKENFNEQISIVFTATDPAEGLKQTKKNLPDLLFLDMDMPRLSGIDILELIDDLDMEVVITTAHQEFAIQAVGTKAIAYLLKPVQPEKLNTIIDNLIKESTKQSETISFKNKLAIPVFDGVEIVDIKDIVYCKSESNYTSFIFDDGKRLVASKTLKFFDSNLPANPFYRVHKSYLINLNHVSKYLKRDGGEIVMANGDVLPVSRNSKDDLLKLIQKSI